jgi:predicted ATPase
MCAAIASARPVAGEPPAEWTEILATPGIVTTTVGPLGPEALAELGRRRLGVERLPESLVTFVAERSEGNPMFAEELLFTLRDNGTVELRDGEARIAEGRADPASWQLPSTVEGLIAERIDRLSPAEQMTMKVASVIGRVFAHSTLANIHPSEEMHHELERHCQSLAQLELTPPVKSQSLLGGAGAGSGGSYKFKSNLLKDVAYNRMLFSQRRELHRKLAEWLEGQGDTEQAAMAPLLAFHWRRAAEDRVIEPAAALKAATYSAKAGSHAMKLHALKEAIGFWNEGLELLHRLPDSEERARHELRVLLELGPAQVAAGSFSAPEVEASFDRARKLCERIGRHAQLFRAVRGLWQVRVGQAAYEMARQLAEELLLLALKDGDSALRLEAHRAAGTTAFWVGDLNDARHHLTRAVELYDPVRHRALAQLYGQDPCVAARGILSWALASAGEAEQAREQARAAVAWGNELQHPFTLAYAHGSEMWAHYFLGERPEAAAAATRCADLSLERGFPYLAVAGRIVHGWAEGAVAEVEGAVRAWRQVSGGIGMPMFLIVQAETQTEAGRAAEALQSLNEPVLLERYNTERWITALYHRIRGGALAAQGDLAGARDAFAVGRDVAEQQGAGLHLARIERAVSALPA